MSLKTCKKWLMSLAVIAAFPLSAYLVLTFILTIEETRMREYEIIYKFWDGIKEASLFCFFLLIFVWIVLLGFTFYVGLSGDNLSDDDYDEPKRKKRVTNTTPVTPIDFDELAYTSTQAEDVPGFYD